MCVGLLNLQPREHKRLQVGNGLPEGVLWNEPVVVIVVIVIVPLHAVLLHLQGCFDDFWWFSNIFQKKSEKHKKVKKKWKKKEV